MSYLQSSNETFKGGAFVKKFTDDEILDAVEPFKKDLTSIINKHSMEKFSDTPDFILADYLVNSLLIFSNATCERDKWYGFVTHIKPEIKP